MNYYEIGQRIRKFRKAHGLSQEELAEKIEISTTHMSHIETGNTKLSLPVLVSLAQTLGVQTDELLFEHPVAGRETHTQDLLVLLDSCTTTELAVLTDILRSAKIALDKYGLY